MTNKKKKVETVHERILALDTKKFLKMGLYELCELRAKAEPDDLTRLNYIMAQTQLESRVGDIVREECTGMGEIKTKLVFEAVLKRLNETGWPRAAGARS